VSLTLAELLGEHWQGYAAANHAHLCAAHYRAVRSVLACRTPELGGQLYRCGDCGAKHFAYHSCNHRNCPGCGALDAQVWTAKQEAKLLPVPYFMVTFTVPEELRRACLAHPAELYDLLLKESAGALQDVLLKKLGGTGGFTSVLHTWTRQMLHHPHVHIIVPGTAYDKASGELRPPAKPEFLVHGSALAARFKLRLAAAIEERHPDIHAEMAPGNQELFGAAKKWVTDVRHVGQGETALRYLARYVNRSALGAKRLIGYDAQGRVLLNWTSSQTGKPGVLSLHPFEFIRRWLLHVLPKGFTRVRHYGFMAGAAKKTRLRVRALLGQIGEPAPRLPEQEPFKCAGCGGALAFAEELARVRPRGPPAWKYYPEKEVAEDAEAETEAEAGPAAEPEKREATHD